MAESKHTPGCQWSAELNHNFRNDIGEPMWVLRYDPTPGGKKNENGTTSFGMSFPALQLTSWVAEPQKAATEIAAMLNSHADLLEALRSLHACVGVMAGRGPDATIPETMTTPIGVPVRIGKIMRDATAAIAKAEGR